MADNTLFTIRRNYTIMSVPTGIVHEVQARSRHRAIMKGVKYFQQAISIIRVSWAGVLTDINGN